jgi:hypothetical protein
MRRHLTTPAVGRLNHDTGLGRKRANRAAHERSSTAGRTNLWSNLWCVWMRAHPNHQRVDIKQMRNPISQPATSEIDCWVSRRYTSSVPGKVLPPKQPRNIAPTTHSHLPSHSPTTRLPHPARTQIRRQIQTDGWEMETACDTHTRSRVYTPDRHAAWCTAIVRPGRISTCTTGSLASTARRRHE